MKSTNRIGIKRYQPVFLSFFFLFASLCAIAQKTITGTVKDDAGSPLQGVNISIKGSGTGTTTDQSGMFRLEVPNATTVLSFSFVGFEPQEITVGDKASIDIKLMKTAANLGEVVVVGYGTQKKVSLTSAVSSVKGEELERRPVSTLEQAMQGQLSGLTVVDQGGSPGNSNPYIRIRGITTLSSNNPLIIVDGIEQPLSDINPNDIETISVLKDASSTAIYGSRAANGVVLITTKRAKGGKTSVTYNGLYAIQKAVSIPEHMELEPYMRLQNIAFTNVGSPAKYTEQQIQDYVNGHASDPYKFPLPFDFYNVMYKNAPQTNHAVAINGGSENFKGRLSLRYQDQDGIIANTNSKLAEVRINTDMKVSSKITVSTDIDYRNNKNIQPHDITNVFLRMMQNSIWTTPKFPDGTYGMGSQKNNPLLYAEQGGIYTRTQDYFSGNIKGDVQLMKGLKFTSQFAGRVSWRGGKDYTNSYEVRDFYNPTVVLKTQPINSLQESRNFFRELTWNNLLDYTRNFGDHGTHLLLGYSQIASKSNNLSAFRQNFYNNNIQSIGQGANDATKDNGGGETQWGLRSYFGRFNYSFNDKYLFEANGRFDGSSRFIGNNRYSFFPSFSGGWRLSKEDFWDNFASTINEFKLRGSWGKTGNQAVDLYSYFQTLNLVTYSFSGVPVQGYTQLQLANQDLTWETTTQSNFGVDLAFLKNKLTLSVDRYHKKTDGILLVLPVPGTLGLQAVAQNAGRVDNSGWEFQAGVRQQWGKFGLNANLNFNVNKNEVIDLAGTGPYISGSDIDPRYIIGEGYPINAFWGYKTDGLYQSDAEAAAAPLFMRTAKAGDVRMVDVNKDGKITAEDMTYIGNSFPKYTYGGNIGLNYQSFTLNITMQGAAKVGARLARALAEQGNYEGFTSAVYTNNFWTPDNPNARFPRPTKQDLRNQASTDRMIFDASYLRVKNLQLAYELPSTLIRKASLTRASVYVSATNVITISKLNRDWHLDPETLSGWQDYYPQTSLYTVGVNLQF